MAIWKLTQGGLSPLAETQFGAEGIAERKDLQKFLKANIRALADDLFVICEEFGDWVDSARRIDLLCIDRDANLVVVELKRTDDGGHMDLQAIRYAAMIAPVTFEQLVQAHEAYLRASGTSPDSAKKSILDFLNWKEPRDDDFGSSVRIVLAAADFRRELTTAVIWLNDQGLDITCIRMKPYRDESGTIYLDVQQIIPLPEAEDYQTQIRAKDQAARIDRGTRHDLRMRFWTQLLALAKTKSDLHAGRNPTKDNWIGGSIGRSAISLNYVCRKFDSQVEIYIREQTKEKSFETFNFLKGNRAVIEGAFGHELDWQDLPDADGCRVRYVLEGGYRSPEEAWPAIQTELADSMIKFDRALRSEIEKLPRN